MDPVIEFFKGLFDTDQWPARWRCGTWSEFHGWLYIISNLMIWVAYFLIPLIIIQYFNGKKATIKFKKVYILFATFILLCGATHFFDAMIFWVPMYRLSALVLFITGVVSLLTVYHLVKILPEAFRQRTNLELEAEIRRRQEAERQLSEANENLQAFASVASHDLQEPLRKIRTYVSLITNGNEIIEGRNRELLDKIEHSSTRMQSMIKDILTLSTILASAEFGKVDINEAVRLAIEDMEVKITEKQAIINVQLMPDVKGNKEYLSQVFMNLISNAIKFSSETPRIDISSETRSHTVVIYVKDNGIGMDPAFLDRIFVAFQRLNPRTAYEGAGLGLAICKRIIELHKGTIRVETQPGAGTTFIIELPRA